MWGSNNWVVHGDRTASGMPLLADDMHLGLNMPSIWTRMACTPAASMSWDTLFPACRW